MSNNYFKFKQFTIFQDACAMKVTTDGCLFGALIAREVSIQHYGNRILDIGTGTGLLALMLAQKNPDVLIDAVEIDEDAARQATFNIKSSSMPATVYVHHQDIIEYPGKHLYDFVFTNPPFFENDLKSPYHSRNKALHDETLTLHDLLTNINRLIKPFGTFSILLPFHRVNFFIQLCHKLEWTCCKQVNIQQTEKHPFFRSILFFNKKNQAAEISTITIMEAGIYSTDFVLLLKDYYLFL